MIAETISHYRILKKLGAGGMGEVYLAEDTQLGRRVAIKLLPPETISDEHARKRLVREARAAATLDHPNICSVYEVGEADGRSFIAMQYLEGETLEARIKSKPLELKESLTIAAQIADALAEAHSHGIIHRDIKPGNIMITSRGQAKVMDFGLARVIAGAVATEAETQSQLTTPGTIMGTMPYMSPEQLRGENLDARTDIFSFGVVLYEMLSGRQPFASESAAATASAILTRDPPRLARFMREVPAELERIVMKALAKHRDERFQTAKDLLIDLKQLKQKLDVEAEIERTAPPELRRAGGDSKPFDAREVVSTVPETAVQSVIAGSRTHSSVEYIVNEIKRHKRVAWLVLAALVTATVALAYFAYSRHFAESNKVNIDSQSSIRSLAVLALTNTGKDPETEYLSDGISESLINRLSQLPGVKVIARSSSFQYKDKEIDPQEVARRLGVEAILTGTVTQRGDTLLISVDLMDARDKTQVWGEQYNRKARDLLQVQAEISHEIAEKLRLRLSAGEQQQLAKRETVYPQAYELLLKAQYYAYKREKDAWKKSLDFYEQAIAVDPNYARGYAALSSFYARFVRGDVIPAKEGMLKAEAAARRALELDDNLAEAHGAMAAVKVYKWEWTAAEQEYKRAVELNPNFVAHADYLSIMGQHEQAVAVAKRAREQNPLMIEANLAVGVRLYFARRYDEAIESLKNTIEMDPSFSNSYSYLGYTYAAKGMYPEAIAAYERTLKDGKYTSDQVSLGTVCAKAGERSKAQAILKHLETTKEYVSPTELAILYGELGDKDAAFASLERAYAAHDYQLQYLGDPEFDSLRADPRFLDLLRRVGLPR